MNAHVLAAAVTLRPARPEDAPAISSLLEQLGYPGTDGFIEGRVRQLLTHPDEALLVADHAGKAVAVISIHFIPQLALPGDFARISYFCVADGLRGGRIGAELEARCVALAKARGCDRVELHCHSRRTGAHRFYERQGYVESPRYYMKPLAAAR